MPIKRITGAFTRFYSDSRQWKAYVTWEDDEGQSGRIEGDAFRRKTPKGEHMRLLFARAKREGVPIEHQSW